MRVIGTAGHVDHGKSTLVQRLTNIDPDRLEEEKAREMTIDLGFAWFDLPSGESVGIVDVPGHRDFIENMLAGVGGIDAVLLVIAADEGVMPQTREHLAILDLLGVENGLIILSKIDLVDDPEWLDLVEQEIRDVVENTALAGADIVRISAYTGDGIADLVEHLEYLLDSLPPRPDYQMPRLPIDRVFTISGFGTVVTGTLTGGKLRVGDDIEIQPSAQRGRIRGLQSHKNKVDVAWPGSRVAVNVSGIDKHDVLRGMVLGHPGKLAPTILADVYYRHLDDASRPLKHNAEIKFFSGAAETTGIVRLLAADTILPGEESWLQIRLKNPVALLEGDRYILRFPSPGETIGGGIVVNPHPGRRWKRHQPDVIQRLETRLIGSPSQRLLDVIREIEPADVSTIAARIELSDEEFDSLMEELLSNQQIIALPDGTYLSRATWQHNTAQMIAVLNAYHETYPLRGGMSRAELRSRLRLQNTMLNFIVEQHDDIIANGNTLRLKHHTIRFTDAQQTRIENMLSHLAEHAYAPPPVNDLLEIVGSEDVFHALVELGEIVQVQPDIVFARQHYDAMVDGVLQLIDAHGAVTAAMLRDHFQTTRKYAIALLEHLDNLGITRRQGDERVRGTRQP
ncbi:MAG: selenocysteine-specific translation elongation factor [Chloroflexi bacterium]|nr:MAG: selenocysteine-specific translation elongation factor [Phototrophicales bacterium]RMF81795.1 MAG: selenocysteine-specific translation elongation factor [Chloroflexota bacterium]